MIMATEPRRKTGETWLWQDKDYVYFRREFSDKTFMIMRKHRVTGQLERCDNIPMEMSGLERIESLPSQAEALLQAVIKLQFADASLEERSNTLFTLSETAARLTAQFNCELTADRNPAVLSELHVGLHKVQHCTLTLLQISKSLITAAMPVTTLNAKVSDRDPDQDKKDADKMARVDAVLEETITYFKPFAAPAPEEEILKGLSILSAVKDVTREIVNALATGTLSEANARQALVLVNKHLTLSAIIIQRDNAVNRSRGVYEAAHAFFKGKAELSFFTAVLDPKSSQPEVESES